MGRHYNKGPLAQIKGGRSPQPRPSPAQLSRVPSGAQVQRTTALMAPPRLRPAPPWAASKPSCGIWLYPQRAPATGSRAQRPQPRPRRGKVGAALGCDFLPVLRHKADLNCAKSKISHTTMMLSLRRIIVFRIMRASKIGITFLLARKT